MRQSRGRTCRAAMVRAKMIALVVCALTGLVVGLAAGQVAWLLWPIN